MVKFQDVKHMTDEEFFNGNQFSIDAFRKKYRLGEDETYVRGLWRVCNEIASVEETDDLKKYWAERWFDEIYNGWWHPAGSIMQGAGNSNSVSLANCTTLSLGAGDEEREWDNLESIIRNTAYSVAKSAAHRQGLGVAFDRLRPRGMSIKNSATESEGSVHWMIFIDSIGYRVGQLGRIPALLFSLRVSHPDIEEFVTVKSDYTKIQNANISVHITNEFYKAVKNDKQWALKFEIPGYKKGDKVYVDKYSALIDSGLYHKDDKGYYYLSPKDRPYEKFEKTISAKKLFRLIAENMWKNAEPGIQNIDIAREYSNSDALYDPMGIYDTRIVSTNAPVVGSTLVPTPNGIFSIKELYDLGESDVLTDTIVTLPEELIDHSSAKKVYGKYNFPTTTFPIKAKFKKYNQQDVYKISLSNQKEFMCNAEHKWLINGNMISTKDIVPGDKLFKPNGGIAQSIDLTIDKKSDMYKEGQLIGYIVGDGWIGKESKTHRKGIGIIYTENDEYFKNLFLSKYKEITGNDLNYEVDRITSKYTKTENSAFIKYIEQYGFGDDKYIVPDICYKNATFCAGFMSGLFSADSYVKWTGKQGCIVLTTISKNLANKVIDLLSNWFGIYPVLKYTDKVKGVKYKTNEGEKISNANPRYDIYISNRIHLIRFRQYIELTNAKQDLLNKVHNNCQQYGNRLYSKVISVEKLDYKEDMYCGVVDGIHSFVIDGHMSSNCSEQYLSRDSLCFLASIIASKFSTNPEEFDKEFSIISPSINRFLDNSISYELEHNRYATPLQKLANEQLRRTGAGVTDVGGWLFKQNLEYDSEQGSDSLELFIKTYNYYLYKSTIELGKEKGNFGAFDKDKIKNSKFIRRMMKEFPDLDFEYMRNVTVSSIAPTGTLTLMARIMLMAYGLEPSFGLYYWKRTRISGKYEYYFIVPNVVREYFKEHGVEIPINSDTIKDTWDGKFGKPIADFIDANKDKLNIKFKYPREIDPIKKMDLMAKVMKWVDSSISITYMLPEDTSIEKVEEFIMRGWEKGVKSIAAFPDMKMYGIISYSPFKDLAVKLKSEGMDIHPQNFSDDELKEMNIEKQNVVFSSAPKRPQKLPADIYIVTVKGEKFIVAVGKLNNVPYEMFAGHLNGFNFKFKEKQGYIEKIKKGQYRLIIGEDIEVDDFAEKFTPIEKALFRQVSTNLRHGTPLKYIVDQLQKSSDDMFSVSAASARVLKKYIKDGEYVTGKACPSCGSTNLIYEEGCVKCTSCSWSKCE